MIETITYRGRNYMKLQAEGNAMKFAKPFFAELIKGEQMGYDIGCSREEWKFDDAIPVDIALGKWSAMNLPHGEVDFIVSSHMLEHYKGRIAEVLEYWLSKIKKGGLICLYLPNMDYQEYWAFGNKKHLHYINPAIMKGTCEHLDIEKFFITEGYDLNGSFYCIIEK